METPPLEPYVFDCWFESGLMPNVSTDKPLAKANFIAEGIDQIRGWFYSLQVLSVMLNKRETFTHVKVNGLILAEDGQKSKRKQNYPDHTRSNIVYADDHLGQTLANIYLTSSLNKIDFSCVQTICHYANRELKIVVTINFEYV